MSNQQAILKVDQLDKIYQGTGYQIEALKKVSFLLEKGEMLAVMGTSGSGKSTLLHILGALDEPSGSKILLNDEMIQNIFTEPFKPIIGEITSDLSSNPIIC